MAAPAWLMLNLLNRALYRLIRALAMTKQIEETNGDDSTDVDIMRKEWIELSKWYSIGTLLLINREEYRRDRRLQELTDFPLSSFNGDIIAQKTAIAASMDTELEQREIDYTENLIQYLHHIRNALKLKENAITNATNFLTTVDDLFPTHKVKTSFLLYRRPVLGLYSQMNYINNDEEATNICGENTIRWKDLTPSLQNQLRLIRLQDGYGWLCIHLWEKELTHHYNFTGYVLQKGSSAVAYLDVPDNKIKRVIESPFTKVKMDAFNQAIRAMRDAIFLAKNIINPKSMDEGSECDMLNAIHVYETAAFSYIGLIESIYQFKQYQRGLQAEGKATATKEEIEDFAESVDIKVDDLCCTLLTWRQLHTKLISSVGTMDVPLTVVERLQKEIQSFERDSEYLSLLLHWQACDSRHLYLINHHPSQLCFESHYPHVMVSEQTTSMAKNLISCGGFISRTLSTKINEQHSNYLVEGLSEYCETMLSSTTSTWYFAKECMFWIIKALQVSFLRKDGFHVFDERELSAKHDLQKFTANFAESDWLKSSCERLNRFVANVALYCRTAFQPSESPWNFCVPESSFVDKELLLALQAMSGHANAEDALKKAAYDWE
jgi:hypothetical protein